MKKPMLLNKSNDLGLDGYDVVRVTCLGCSESVIFRGIWGDPYIPVSFLCPHCGCVTMTPDSHYRMVRQFIKP